MLPHLVLISSLVLGASLLLLGNALNNTLLVVRGSLEGFSEQMLGFIGSAYFVGYLLGAYIAPALIRSIGHIRAFAFFAAAIAAFILMYALFVDQWVWLGLRFVTGIALIGFYMIIESWLNSQSPADRRGQVFAVYMVANMLSMAAAQQFLRLAPPQTFVLFSVAAIMVCLSVMPVATTRLPQPAINSAPRLSLRRLWRAAPIAVTGALTSGLAMGTFWSMGPLYAINMGLNSGGVATLMTITIVGGAAMQWPLGRFSDRDDRRRVLAIVTGGAALAAAVMTLFGRYEYVLFSATFVFGGMAFSVYPIAIAHLIDHLPHDEILSGNSGVLLLYGVGAIVGPALTGWLMGIGGAVVFPAFCMTTLGLLSLFTIIAMRRRIDEIVDEPAQFVAMMRTAPTAMEMAAAVEEHRLETAAGELRQDIAGLSDDGGADAKHETEDLTADENDADDGEAPIAAEPPPPLEMEPSCDDGAQAANGEPARRE